MVGYGKHPFTSFGTFMDSLSIHDLLVAFVAAILGILSYMAWFQWRQAFCRNELAQMRVEFGELRQHCDTERLLLLERLTELQAEVDRLRMAVDAYEIDARVRRKMGSQE